MSLQGEKETYLYSVSNQTEFQMKLKLWQAWVKADCFIHFSRLAKHSPMNSKKYNFFSIWYKNVKHISRLLRKYYFVIIVTPFSVDINIELKETSDHVSAPGFHSPYLSRDKQPSIHSHFLTMPSLLVALTFVRNYFQE